MPPNDGHPPLNPDAAGARFLAATSMLGFFALASRLLGLARDMAMAWLLGGGPMADALVAAMRIPHAMRRLLGEGSLSMLLTAELVRRGRSESGLRGLGSLAAALSSRLALSLAFLTLAAFVFAPWLTTVLTPGFAGGQAACVTRLMRLCFPYMFMAGMAGLCMAVLHSLGHFRIPAASPVLFNVVMLFFAGTAAVFHLPPAETLAVGMLCGGLAQWRMQAASLRRLLVQAGAISCGAQGAAGTGNGREAWRRIGRLPCGLLGAAAPQLTMLVAAGFASTLGQGQVAVLYYAERLLELPLGLTGVCLGMAGLPSLSRFAAAQDYGAFCIQLGCSLRWTTLLILPACAGLLAVGQDLVGALLEHGKFDARAAEDTWLALCAYVPALPAAALNRSFLAACYALAKGRQAALSTCWAVSLTFAGGLAGLPPALAVGAGLWAQTMALWVTLAAGLARLGGGRLALLDLLPLNILAQQGLGAFSAGLAAQGAMAALSCADFPCGVWMALLLAILAGFLAWAAVLWLAGNADIRFFLRKLRQQ